MRNDRHNVNVTTLRVASWCKGVVPSYGSTTPYQIHIYKRRSRASRRYTARQDSCTLGRVLVNHPAALFRQLTMIALIVLSALSALALSESSYVPLVANYVGYPFAYDGRVLDTPEVARAKATHLATQAYEAVRNTLGYAHVPVLFRVYAPTITSGAPIGADGRVVDTPEVAEAKAAHLTAHALEIAKKLGLYPYGALAYTSAPYAYGFGYGAPLGPDGRVVDTPEVSEAKTAHLAAHAQETTKNSGSY